MKALLSITSLMWACQPKALSQRPQQEQNGHSIKNQGGNISWKTSMRPVFICISTLAAGAIYELQKIKC